MTKPLNICVVSTSVFNTVSFCDEFRSGLKVQGEIHEMAAGVGLNAAIAAHSLAALRGHAAHTNFVTELGLSCPENHYKYGLETLIAQDLAGFNHGSVFNIMDLAGDDPEVRVRNIPILVERNKKGQRGNVQPQPQPRLMHYFNTRARDMLTKAVEASDVLVLNSRMPQESALASAIAYRSAIPVVLDFNSEDQGFIQSPHFEKILACTSHLLVPAETVIYGRMDKTDPDELKRVLLRYYAKDKFIAISDGGNPVDVLINGQQMQSFAPPPFTSDSPDTLGCGDARTGAFATLIAEGVPSQLAIRAASAFATFTGNHRLRGWLAEDIRPQLAETVKRELASCDL